MPSEPDLSDLFHETGAAEKSFCYPRCGDSDSALRFYAVEEEAQLRPSQLGAFREPDPSACREIAPGEIDLVIVPGVAFTPDGATRLGRGGGFYDRFLSEPTLEAKSIGVCFALQLRENLPREAHDLPVDLVITEEMLP